MWTLQGNVPLWFSTFPPTKVRGNMNTCKGFKQLLLKNYIQFMQFHQWPVKISNTIKNAVSHLIKSLHRLSFSSIIDLVDFYLINYTI